MISGCGFTEDRVGNFYIDAKTDGSGNLTEWDDEVYLTQGELLTSYLPPTEIYMQDGCWLPAGQSSNVDSPGTWTMTVNCAQPPNIIFNGANVAGQTTTVVVGQEIMLSGQSTQTCGTVASQQWSLPTGNAVGGYTPTPNSYATGSVVALPTDLTTTSYGPFYWISPGTYNITYQYTLTNGMVSPVSTATFEVVGPTKVKLYTCGGFVPPAGCKKNAPLGEVVIIPGPALAFGDPPTNIGISFTAKATEPAGYQSSDNFEWVQLITNDEVTFTPTSGKVQICTPDIVPAGSTFPALDTAYPQGLDENPTEDSPSIGLPSGYKQVSRTFSATMYLMWNSGLADSIPVPLGSVQWKFSAAAEFLNNTWTFKSGRGSAKPFVASSSYATWTSVVPYDGKLICVGK
jgi:hypothetical protein